MEQLQIIETATGQYFIEDGIVHVVFFEDADIDLEASMQGVAVRKELQQGRKMPVLVDTSKVWQVTKESRNYSAQEDVDGMNTAMGIVTGGSFVAITAANFFIKFNKPTVPTRIFKTQEKALKWLRNFR